MTTKKTTTTKATKTSVPAIEQEGAQEPVSVTPVYHTDPEVIRRLDRIVELLEGTLTVDRKGLNLSGKFWDRLLDPDK